VLYGRRDEFKEPRLILEVPSKIKVSEIDFSITTRNGSRSSEILIPVINETRRNNVLCRRYSVAVPDKWDLTGASYVASLSGFSPRITVYFETTDGRDEKDYSVYWFVENAGLRSKENRFVLRFLPPMEKTLNPRVFKGVVWCTNDLSPQDIGLLDRALGKYEEAGIKRKWVLHDVSGSVNERMLKRGWELSHFVGGGNFSIYIPRAWMPAKLRNKVRWAVGTDGLISTTIYGGKFEENATSCPTYALKNSEYGSWARKFIQNVVKNVKNGATICLDSEPFNLPSKECFCKECIKAFSARYNIPKEKIPGSKEILKNYKKEWGQFWCHLISGMLSEAKEAIKETHPDSKVFMYDYINNYDDAPGIEKILFSCPLDSRLIDKVLDGHALSIAGSYRNDLLNNLDMMSKVLKKPVIVNPRISRFIGATAGYTSRDDALSPDAFRLQLIGSAASGAEGFVIFPGIFIDGMFFKEADKAMKEIAIVEDFYLQGKRCDKDFAITLKNKGVIDVKRDIGIRGHRLGNKILVTVFNFNKSEDASIELAVAVNRGQFMIWNPIEEKTFKSPGGKTVWSRSEVKKGIPYIVPAHDVKFLILGPKE